MAAGHSGDGEGERVSICVPCVCSLFVHDLTSRSIARLASVMMRSRLGLVVGLDGVGDAVTEVIVEQLHGNALQRPGRCRHLREHVDAVRVVVDHPLQATDLPLDPLEASEDRRLVVVVPGRRHAHTLPGYD